MESNWQLYILRCGDGTLYTGIAVDVEKRLAAHNSGRGAKYTRGRGPLTLVYRENCGSHSDALKREYSVKQLSRQEKESMIDAYQKRLGSDNMIIRHAEIEDLEEIAAVESKCFPPKEVAQKETFRARLTVYPEHFWLMLDGDHLVSFVNGFVTDEPDLTDEMFSNATQHNPRGKWQMIFGVNTLPEYRQRGFAGRLLDCAIEQARQQGRDGVVLTCKEEKLSYYRKFGFENEGITSKSIHGGAVWYQMRLTFRNNEHL